MTGLKIVKRVIGEVQTNCYFVVNEENNKALIIDPAGDIPADSADYIIKKCEELKITPVAVLLTHGHFDHTGAVGGLKEKLNIAIYAGEDEKPVLSDPSVNGLYLFASEAVRRGARPVEADFWLRDGETISPCGFPVKIIATPGHTVGGICYYIESENVLFSGDVLFENSFGRTDLPTGDQNALSNSIINKLFVLPEQTKVYPGHGGSTSIKYEKKNNPIYNY
ncbi:MAG: MBL fold metallo-hydrolase [Oscillospiraceae bacterium]|nr:MBL fold metallo-hydrolase [Oscillospiraceae bacterium]